MEAGGTVSSHGDGPGGIDAGDLGELLARAGLHLRVLDADGAPRYDNAAALAPSDGVRESREVRVRDRRAYHHLLLELPLDGGDGGSATPGAGQQGAAGCLELAVDVTDATRPRASVEASPGEERAAASGPNAREAAEPDDGAALAGAKAEVADLTADNVALRRSNRDLSEFAYIVSHDLAAPLRVISGYVQLLARRYGDALDERAGRWIDWTVDGVERMEELLAGLLDYARLDSEGVAHGPVDLAAVLGEAVAATVGGDEGVLEVRSEGLPVVDGDASQLRQLLANLLSNAAKFRHPDRAPVVEVRARWEPPRWRVAVADNGVGIPAEHRGRALRMFGRLHTREEVAGTGVGLAIAQRVVERHGGTLSLHDSDLGGTELRFDLPPAGAPAQATAEAGAETGQGGQ